MHQLYSTLRVEGKQFVHYHDCSSSDGLSLGRGRGSLCPSVSEGEPYSVPRTYIFEKDRLSVTAGRYTGAMERKDEETFHNLITKQFVVTY